MPYVRRWPDDEENQLILTEHELKRFGLAGNAMRSYAVKPDSKLPTALIHGEAKHNHVHVIADLKGSVTACSNPRVCTHS
jgi:hypothetical protein